MMGIQEPDQSKIFYTNINIAERIRRDHPLRRIAAKVDFDFTYREVADRYGTKGNVSVPPPVEEPYRCQTYTDCCPNGVKEGKKGVIPGKMNPYRCQTYTFDKLSISRVFRGKSWE